MSKLFTFLLLAIISLINSFSQTRLNESFSDSENIFDWTIINRDNGIQTWQRITSKFRTAPASITCRFESSTLQNDDWLITKKLFVTAGDSLSFWHSILSSAYPESLYVKVGTTNNPNASGWQNLAVIYDQTTSWKNKKYSLAAYTGQQIYIAFVNRSKDAFNIYLDDITGPQVVKPNYDLALVNFYQYTGLSVQSFGEKIVEENKSLVKIEESTNGFRQSEINLTKYSFDPFPENTELNNVYLRAVVKNFGLFSTNYFLKWSVSSAVQSPVTGNSVQPQAKDSINISFSPPARGTYLVNGTINVGGDEYSTNNSLSFRMLVYPNSFTRTIYDRGDNNADTWMGFGNPFVHFKAGMRYTATSDIKLAGVDFLYQTEFGTSGQIEVQVRGAGPNNNMPGPVIYNKIYNSSVYLTRAGDYVHFAFDDNAPVISAGSDYWITIKLPLGIQYPCAVQNDDFVSGRCYYQGISDTTMWFPLIIQSVERCWIMRAIHTPIPSSFPFTASINNGWNLLSIPGAHPDNQHINTWWRFRDPAAQVFILNGSYQSVTDLTPGSGYWMKHLNFRIYNTGDEWPASGILYVPNIPVQCNAGWNLIGPYQSAVPVSSITTTPPNLISSQFFGFTQGNGFQNVSVLNPGYGYLVKLSGAGKINLTPTFSDKIQVNNIKEHSDWIKLIFTDALDKSSVLYITSKNEQTDYYELPPIPFPDIFDVRFSSGKYVECGSEEKSIQFQGVSYPVKIKVQNGQLKVRLEKGYENILSEENELKIEDETIKKIFIQSEIVLNEFRLYQNYPNPFNPTTKISWHSPTDSWQKLTIYDILGNEVTTLVDEFRESGNYQVEFNASQLTTGIYYYKLTAGNFSEVKKMLLIK